jgi:hypothetical protein
MRSLATLAAALLLVSTSAAAALAEAPPGGIKGTVIFVGEAPDRAPLDRKADPACAKTQRLSEDIVVTHGKLAGALVRVVSGDPPPPPTVPKAALPPVVVDEQDCMYGPRVFTLEPSQGIVVRNGDNTAHHVRGKLAGKDLFDKALPKKAPDATFDPPTGKPGDVVELTDDSHPWMHAYGVLSENAFHAVTGEAGTFEITGLAPGKYTLEAWHPLFGKRTMNVVIGRGPNKAIAHATITYRKDEL